MAFEPPTQGQWTTGLCACCEDCSSCCCAYWCPCVVVGRLVEIIDQGRTTCFYAGRLFYSLQFCTGCCGLLAIIGWCGCGFIYTCGYRARLRGKFNLPEGGCSDCCTDACCLCCSIAQQYRELQFRGIDPATGYFANQEAYHRSSKNPQKGAPAAQVIVYQQAAPAPQRMPSRQSAPAPPRTLAYQQAAPPPQMMPYHQAAPGVPQRMPYHQATPGVPQRMPYQQSAPPPQRMPYQQSARAPQKLLEYK